YRVARRGYGGKPRRPAPPKPHRRLARRKNDDAHVAPADAKTEPGAERLGRSLLGGTAVGLRGGAARAALRFRTLGLGKAAQNKPLAEARQCPFDASDVAEIVAKADDHSFIAIQQGSA